MKSAGITVRPLVLMNGHSHFNEVFFDNAQVPKENLVGPLNEGWKVAMTTLSYERAFAGGGGHASQVRRLAELAKIVAIDGKPAWEQEWVRQQLAQFIIECEAARYTQPAIAHAPTARIAAGTRGLDAQAVRLRTRRAHRALLD